jgi:hypothetical protein
MAYPLPVDEKGTFHNILRYVNRRTLRVLVPPAYQREHGLDAGDHYVWIPQPDGSVRIKFVRTSKLAETASV